MGCCCSLQVVSTNVGGVPEVLPPHLIRLAEPSAKGYSNVFIRYCIQLLLPAFFCCRCGILQKSNQYSLTYAVY